MDKKTILHILFLFAISAALIYLTDSLLMSIGIMMLLLLVDVYLRQYDSRKRKEWEEQNLPQDEHENDKQED